MNSVLAAHLSHGKTLVGTQLPALSNQPDFANHCGEIALILLFLMHRKGIVIHFLQ